MIQDIFEMPFPLKKDIMFSSTVPLIMYNEAERAEDYYWFGRNIDITKEAISRYHRYKFLEYVGDMCVERVFITEEPIKVDSDWSKSEVPIMPIYARRYMLRANRSCFDRYLSGCWTMLENFDMCEENLATIHERTLRHLERWRDIPGLKMDEYFNKVITGKTVDNLSTFQAVLECSGIDYDWNAPFYAQLLQNQADQIQPDKVTDKTTRTIARPELRLKDLNRLKSRTTGLWNIGVISGKPARMFDPNGKDVQYGFNNEYSKWEQIGILDSLFWSNLTDIYFDVSFRERDDFTINDIDMLNRYTGFHVDAMNCEDHNLVIKNGLELIIALSKCAMEIPTENHHLSRLRVQMNWWDEIYIEIYLGDKEVYRYWFDTTVCTLADPAIMNSLD